MSAENRATMERFWKKYSLRRSGTNLSLQCREHGLVQVVHSGTTIEQLLKIATEHEEKHTKETK